MRSLAVVVIDVVAKNQPQVALAEDEQPVQGLVANGLDHPLAMGVGLWAPIGSRIEGVSARELGEVTAEPVQKGRLRGLLGRQLGVFHGGVVEQALDLGPHFVQGGAEVHENVGADTLPLGEQAKQQVFAADVVVPIRASPWARVKTFLARSVNLSNGYTVLLSLGPGLLG